MQKTSEKEDLRVLRTRVLLRKALFDLTIEKGFADLTVRDIANRAMVNRSTFYRHYLDKYDLLHQYLDDLQHMVEQAAVQSQASPVPEKIPSGLLLLLRHIQDNAAFYRVMLGPNGDSRFVHRFRQLPEARYRGLFSRQPSPPSAPPIDLKLGYIAAATLGAILWWLEHDQPFSVEDLAVWLGQLNLTSAGLPRPG